MPNTTFRILVFALLHVLVSVVFLKGFLLTRIELQDISRAPSDPSHSPISYSKTVILIVDALRHDFLCAQPGSSNSSSSAGLLPKTLGLVNAAAGAAVASRFIADTPTITMSRLKALLTGGLPTFLDVGQSFSASALTEDNLLLQLKGQQKRMVVLGDDTWMQLAKDMFAEAYPYPSFDVHDLHTVDDGVWQHLMPLLGRPDSWDVLIAHYLGVDHAGHTYGVNSPQMAAKLSQMDDQISHVIESLVAQAGPGGAYQDALLLVLSDHGQTLGGDHGGGSPAETDSVLLAMGLSRMHAALQDKAVGSGTTWQQHLPASVNSSFQVMQSLSAAVGYLEEAADAGQQQEPGAEGAGIWLCATRMSQIDLTPTLAHLLGLPIPFGNLGRLPPYLHWALARPHHTDRSTWLSRYSVALQQNVEQVHTYLNHYVTVGSLSNAQLASINSLYLQLQQFVQPPNSNEAAEGADGIGTKDAATEATVVAQLVFLGAAADLARRHFTLFQQGPIWAGCGLGAVVLAAQLLHCWYAVRSLSITQGAQARANTSNLLFTCLAAFHVLGLFSVGLLMGEGRLQCVLLAVVTLLMAWCTLAFVSTAHSLAQARQKMAKNSCGVQGPPAAMQDGDGADGPAPVAVSAEGSPGSAALQAGRHAVRLTSAGMTAAVTMADAAVQWWSSSWPVINAAAVTAVMLACNVALQALGLIDRAGQDPHDKTQPSADLLVGPDAAWQRALYISATAGPLVVLWVCTNWCSRWACRQQQPQPPASAGSSLGPAMVCLCKYLAGVQCVSQCTFWIALLTGRSQCNLLSIIIVLCTAVQQVSWLQPVLQAAHDFYTVTGRPAQALLLVPLRLLLPQLVYAAALLAVCAVLLVGVLRATSRLLQQQHTSVKHLNGAGAGMEEGCQLWVWLCAVVAAPLVTVLGYKGPVLMALAVLQAVCVCCLLRLQSSAAAFSISAAKGAATAATAVDTSATATCGKHVSRTCNSGLVANNFSSESCQLLQPAVDPSLSPMIGAGSWAMMSLQLFFCSGHFCEFSGLQYASAFIGFDSMVWYLSGSLLLLNTCGFLLLGCISLPLMHLTVGLRSGSSDGHRYTASWKNLRQQVAGSMSVVNTMRFAALVVCMVSAAVQQQHILLWAIFAPKLVFELWFMAVVDVAQVLTSVLVELWL